MKRLMVTAFLCASALIGSAQFIYKIKADSILMTNDTCNAELNLENGTRNVKGFLYNRGNGRTEFRRAAINDGDSIYIIGGDTIRLSGLTGGSGGAGNVPISSLYPALNSNSIDNTDYAQEWKWNTLSNNSALKLSSNSTLASGNLQTLLDVILSGANSNANQSSYAIKSLNTHTGTGGINYGGYFSATNGAGNIGLHATGSTYGIEANSSGSAVRANGGIYGVEAFATSIGVLGNGTNGGVAGASNGGFGGIYGQSNTSYAGVFHAQGSVDSTSIRPIVALWRTWVNGGGNGIGASIDYILQTNSSPNMRIASRLISKYLDATDATITGEFDIDVVNNGTIGTKLKLNGPGQITLPGYSSAGFYVNDTTSYKPLVVNSSGAVYQGSWSGSGGGGGGTTSLSGITAATGTNTINSANYAQEWQWNTLAGTSALKLSSTSTAAASNLQKMLEISLSGANSNSSQSTYGIYIENNHTGTTASSFGIYSKAAQYGGYFESDANVGLVGYTNTGTGLSASASSSGLGLHAQSVSGTGLRATTVSGAYAAEFSTIPTTTSSIVPNIKISTGSSGTGASGLGGSIDFAIETDANNSRISNQLISKHTSAADGSRTSQFEIWGVNSGTTARKLAIAGNGIVTMDAYGAGTATFDASGNISSVSDVRLKNVQGDFTSGIEAINKINPIVYKWNEISGFEMDHSYAGFSAQNIQSALGELAVGHNKDGYLSLQDRTILAALVNAVKEQQIEIEKLKRIIRN